MGNKQLQIFYKSFYGESFHRFFRRIPEFENPIIRKEFFATNPIQLWYYLGKYGMGFPCYISVYDYGNEDNLKNRNKGAIKLDRVFLDFDIDNSVAKEIKNKLCYIRSQGSNHLINEQKLLMKKAADLVINQNIAEPAINDAKIFAETFRDEFDVYPALFFSGFKGCHAYCFFEPVKLTNPNETITHFARKFKNVIGLDTMDLSVNLDATSRLSRVPYSKHHITGLTVVPFNLDDTYQKIVEKAVNPGLESFNTSDKFSRLNEHLKEIDAILEYNHQIKNESSKKIKYKRSNEFDHRNFFKELIGEPVKEYKGYNMYHCPFTCHDDNNPSFKVTIKGYSCYGCKKWGNYWQFFKDLNGWNDDQVKKYLKKQDVMK